MRCNTCLTKETCRIRARCAPVAKQHLYFGDRGDGEVRPFDGKEEGMKEIREYLDAMSEARSFADVNIAAGVALPMVSKIARRVVIILALTLLVTTAAFARVCASRPAAGAGRRAAPVHARGMTRTNEKQHRVMVAKIVEAKKQRELLATEVSHLRSELRRRSWRSRSRSAVERARERRPVQRRRPPRPPLDPPNCARRGSATGEEPPPAPPRPRSRLASRRSPLGASARRNSPRRGAAFSHASGGTVAGARSVRGTGRSGTRA